MDTLIVYASMSGTTENMARIIAEELTNAGDYVIIKDAIECYAEELRSFDRILIGSHTWGDGELSDEIIGFYDELVNIDLADKPAAVFGPGDSSYEHFANAVDILEETLRNQGCEIITQGLKVDSGFEDEVEIKTRCISFAKKVIDLSPSLRLEASNF